MPERSGVPAVPARTAAAPVNLALMLGAAGLIAAWVLWPGADSAWSQHMWCGVAAAAGGLGTLTGVRLLARDFALRRNLDRAVQVTDDHGSARQSTPEERTARGMHDASSGMLLGRDDRGHPVYAPPKTPVALIEMPQGGGKSSALVLGSILHRAFLGTSMLVADPKLELAPMLAPALRALGFEVWCINPTLQFLDLCGATEINLYQPVLDAVYAEDDARLDAATRAMDVARLHVPEDGIKDNIYFILSAQRVIWTAILILALLNLAECTPSGVFVLLSRPRKLLKLLARVRDGLEGLDPDDALVDFVRGEADDLLHRARDNKNNFGVFLEQATQRMADFNQAGRLAGYGATAIHNLAALRQRQVIVFIMAPLSHSRGFASFLSILNYNLLAVCKQHARGHPVHIVGEEFLAYRFQDIETDLETMRGLKVTADFYIQSYAGLEKKYGREVAAAIDAYSEVKVYGALNSYDQAKRVSDMLAEATIRKQDYSYKSVVTDLGVSSREMGRRLMTPDEILSMPRDKAWLFVRGLRPTLITLTHYGQVDPWRDWVGENPIEGGRLRANPVLRIDYPERRKP